MAQHLISPGMSVQLAAARTAVTAAYNMDSKDDLAWWQGVAVADERLGRLLREQQTAMVTADAVLRRAAWDDECPHPDLELYRAVSDAAHFHQANAEYARQQAAEISARRAEGCV
jgi:hypothetical protein